MKEPEILHVAEIATRLRCHPVTVRRWIASGALRASKVGSAGRWRVRREDLREFLRHGETCSICRGDPHHWSDCPELEPI